MASRSDVCAGLLRHQTILLRELCDTNVLDVLVKKGVIGLYDHEQITSAVDSDKCSYFISAVSKQSPAKLSELCAILERECPKLTKELINDQICLITNGYHTENSKENMVMDYNINRESPRSRRSASACSCGSRASPAPPPPPPPLNNTLEVYVEPVVEDATERNSGWETHRVRLNRVPGYGFGIAVSGGRDNPHFASGDPSIAVSDVLRGGPAEDKLQVNDRIVSVNGVGLENAEYARAVQVLRDSGAAVTLVVRRRAPAPPHTAPLTLKLALTRNGKKEDFGIVLGCKLYVKELTLRAREQLNAAGQGLCEGDVVTKINNTSITDSTTLKEAKKLIEGCKDRLSLVVTRELIREETVTNGNVYQNNFNTLGGEQLSSAYSGQNLYVAAPSRGGAPADSRRGPHEIDQPPRPPPPRNDDYYSRRQLYEEDGMVARSKPSSEPRLISFLKEGSVGLRLCGGNQSGVFVSGVQPTSPAALQGLQPADKILKVNDMEMKGMTREEAVLFLLSLQERIDLIVQHAPEEYNAVATGQTAGDSFHIKTHFHYSEPTDGEMSFRCGDVFHVVDTLHNGTVGAWQVFRIGRNNQEVQKGIIPNKARAEELATAQFNATKKELSGSDGKTNFFRRRRSTHRRSKSLGREHWDEVVLSDSISKFPAYERVVLRAPAFIRPVVVFGAISDLARETMLNTAPDKYASPQMDNALEDKSKPGIIRLSGIRSIMDRGKHAVLDITPNAVDRLNYAQFYPIVIFLKADNKHTVKQLRAGMPKSAHKSSKKLLEQSQQLERVWGHVFTHTISLNETNLNTWYSKLTDLISRTQQQQLWVAETKRSEPLSDDFLFPMSTSTENRLSYASSPESDLEVSPPPAPRLVKSSSDPSVATTQDNMDRDDDLNHMNDAVPPPYTSGYGDSKYGFSSTTNGQGPVGNHASQGSQHLPNHMAQDSQLYPRSPMAHSPPLSPLYGTVPELPPRGPVSRPTGGVLLPAVPPGRTNHGLRHNPSTSRPSAQERLFGSGPGAGAGAGVGAGGNGLSLSNGEEGGTYTARPSSMVQPSGPAAPPNAHSGSLDRHTHNTNPYDGAPTYDYTSTQPSSGSGSLGNSTIRLGPNAPDDLKVAPSSKYEGSGGGMMNSALPMPASPQRASNPNPNPSEHPSLEYRSNADPNYRGMEFRGGPGNMGRPANGLPNTPMHARGPSLPNVTTSDYSKYSSRTNSASNADYVGARGAGGGGGVSGGAAAGPAVPPYKPVPPPKPKHYRPPDHPHSFAHSNGDSQPVSSPTNSRVAPSNGFSYYGAPGGQPQYQHSHSHSQPAPHYPPHQYPQQQNMYGGGGGGGNVPQSPPYSGPPSHHRAINLPHNPHLIDLAGSREQRGSAFELYRKPQQHMHNVSAEANSSIERDANFSPKTKKKLSKKPSFIKNAVLDLFRSKSKSTHKVSRQKSLCERDLQQRNQNSLNQLPMLRREKSDLSDMSVHMKNVQIRNQILTRGGSSCEKLVLKPILKRQSSFCNEVSGATCTIRDYDAKPIVRNLRRQNSMCDIETEPKVTPLLRRQNSLIEYNRRGLYGQVQNFNMITRIDPIYQRQHDIKHEPFNPTQPLPPEPLYQSKEHIIYDPIPKPRRTYTSHYGQNTENLYAARCEVQGIEDPYGNRQTLLEPPYASKNECISRELEPPYASKSECISRESPYVTKLELNSHKITESFYGESPYSSKEQMLKQRMYSESPYATKEDMLRQRFSESPYSSKDEAKTSYAKEQIYGKRTYEPPNTWESPYASRSECRKLQTPVHFPGRSSPMSKCMSEPPYATKAEMLSRLGQTESPYSTRSEIKSCCSENSYPIRQEYENQEIIRPLSAECTYVSRQEILSQKAALSANKEPICNNSPQEKLGIIKQRNQAKKEMIYQSRKEVEGEKNREPIYVSKRELKDSVIYESHNEGRDPQSIIEEISERGSPYELSDANHLSRRGSIYQTKAEALADAEVPFQEVDFSSLRLTDCKTDAEKETMKLESAVLQGEPLYAPRLHGKKEHISSVLKSDIPVAPYESTTSMETHYASECSMNFDNKPQSTPYTSQDLEDKASELKRTVKFSEEIAEKSPETSQETSGNLTENNDTVINNEKTVIELISTEIVESSSGTQALNSTLDTVVEPEGPHTTWGIFDSEGGVLEDRQWGVSLIIPPKAIAPGIKQKIYFTVTDPRHSQRVGGPPIDMDNGEAMLSPLVMCGPQGLVFLRPVTLRLPHCANAVPSLGLTIKATDTEAHLSTDWDNTLLPATTTLNTVAVKVDHF